MLQNFASPVESALNAIRRALDQVASLALADRADDTPFDLFGYASAMQVRKMLGAMADRDAWPEVVVVDDADLDGRGAVYDAATDRIIIAGARHAQGVAEQGGKLGDAVDALGQALEARLGGADAQHLGARLVEFAIARAQAREATDSADAGRSGSERGAAVAVGALEVVLGTAGDAAAQTLVGAKTRGDFSSLLTVAFGDSLDQQAADAALQEILSGQGPRIEIVGAGVLNGAFAAYDRGDNTIMISSDFLRAHADDKDAIAAVLIEEYGHYIDAQANASDAPGDEGELFARLVRGEQLSAAEIDALRAQQDQGTVIVAGAPASVEFATVVDGSLADWTAGDRLDAAGGGVAGYELYGRSEGGVYYFAIKAPTGVSVGANTTLWLNTDLNLATGYQVWGFAAGAEYNINFNASGVPGLYTGADGQTAVPNATVNYAYDAAHNVVELAVSADLLGNTSALSVYTDVNNNVFLPNSYANYTYTVSAPVALPPVAVGNMTLDGSLADWTQAERIDLSLGVSGYEIYGKYTGDNYVIAIKSAVPIGANTTAWLNTDQNALTGYDIFGLGMHHGGAEYNVDFDALGNAVLYTGAAGQTAVAGGDIIERLSADKTIVEFAIPKELLGFLGTASAINTLYDINNNVYLPTAYLDTQYTIAMPGGPVVGTVTLDGALGDWVAADRIDGVAPVAGYEVYGKTSGDSFVLAIKAPTGVVIGANTTIWLNSDQNAATGFQIFGGPNGADYNINFDAQGVAHLYTGDAGQTEVPGVTILSGRSGDGTRLELAVQQSALGNPQAINTLIDVNNTTFLPGSFSGPQYSIASPVAPVVGTVTLDGSLLNDWSEANRIDGVAPVAGYAVYGKVSGDSYVFAIAVPTAIGANTTAWLNSDQNVATGFDIFAGAPAEGGAEYNINFDAQGVPHLYTGDAGQTVVPGTVLYGRSADGMTVEFAVNKVDIGSPTAINTLFDVNNSAFLPGNFSGPQYTVSDAGTLPPRTDFSKKVAIVYSETTAALYFGHADINVNQTGYSQLFMAAQSQAAIAGVPYDILTEADLKDLGNLVNYDAIVFPSFQFVKAADATAIQSNLTLLAQNYDTSLIAAGNFMTADENGTVLPGDAYATMKTLFDLAPVASGFSGTTGVAVSAVAAGFAGVGGYTPGEIIHAYTNVVGGIPQEGGGGVIGGTVTEGVGWLSFGDSGGNGTISVIDQQVITGTGAGTYDAVVTSSNNGDRNVHFSTEALLGDNNQLWQAIEYAVNGDTGPSVGLQMGRENAIVAARNDMDQSQYFTDVDPVTGTGIYDALLPILAQWKADYNFVGSYYVNVGAYPTEAEEYTNWTVSKPFFDAIVALGNEIGSHSYTHPANTNLLLPENLDQATLDQRIAAYNAAGAAGVCYCPYCMREDTNPEVLSALSTMTVEQINQTLATALAATDFSNPSRVDASTLDPVSKAILEASYKFQFATSRHAIEAGLGYGITGAAIPGAPEQLPTSLEVLQYYEYLSGGYASVGAGYPGAFGYILPSVQDKVYIAPNASFDFTLNEFRGMTPEQADAFWAAEWNGLTAHSDLPIVVWPWHDYGPTEWMINAPDASPYSITQYENYLARAAAFGTEFVTLADLAERIEMFEKSVVNYSVNGNLVTASVTPGAGGSVGKFALDVDNIGTQVIASVEGWYAYDNDSVFTDRDGGTYNITLGAAAAAVSHITDVGDRNELVSLTGDGTDLAFTIIGEGKVVIDLKGSQTALVTGATVVSQTGDILIIDLGAIGSHDVTVTPQIGTNAAPAISSNGGGASAATSYAENGTAVLTTVTATDADAGQTLTYSLGGGADDALFSINASTGVLSFIASPDFETPLDAGGNNVYDVVVKATDNFDPAASDTQAIAVTVTNINGTTYNGTSAANTVSGTVEPDTLNGAGGADRLSGLGGNDTINGGAGNDPLLDGGDGNDTISGAGGTDTLLGGNGDDRLSGGAGLDTMTGGLGADVFVFATAAESGTGTSRDNILDFAVGVDRIDISVFDANTTLTGIQDFTFLGESATSPLAGQLRTRYDSAANLTYVEGNTNANATMEFQIKLAGQISLSAADFVI